MSNKKEFYEKVPNKPLSEREDKITEFWKENKVFEKSVEQRPVEKSFSFLDGPPFVTGIPHWGHFAGRIAKDVVPRYKTMKGYRVRRVWGWDTHGLPIEEKTEKKLGLKNRREIEDYGVDNFLTACKTYVEEVSSEWEWYVDKIGEWIDFKNAYRTMDEDYMESVIWVFKELWDKGLIYEGAKTLLFCPRCGTPVSKFEIAMDDSYRETEDMSVTVKFPLNYYKSGRGVGVVLRNEKGEVLMGVRDEDGREKSVGIIGGKLEGEESIEKTIKRECKEEIGVHPEEFKIVGSSVDIFEGRLFHTYHVEATLKADTILEVCDAFSKMEWVKEEDIQWDKLHIPTKNALLDVLDKKEFPKVEEEKPDVYVLAWTTTPWTLPSNRALVVDKNSMYITIKQDNEYLVLAKERVDEVVEGDYEVVDEYLGKELVGLNYEGPYSFVDRNENDWKVYDYEGMVTMDDGTGIVHSAPGFGEIDTEMGLDKGLTVMFTVDDEGKFKEEMGDFKGIYIKDADEQVITDLEERNLLFKKELYKHRYPFCWRCETPLFHRSLQSWFINVQELKPLLIKQAKEVKFAPSKFHKRFIDNIKEAPDWCISRTRYWATAMPVWKCDKCEELEVFGSKEAIKDRSGQKVETLHRDGVDNITFSCKNCDGEMTRVSEVLDCWLESGSMPYGQVHYPFENEELFKHTFPADYIVEYVAQLRAWFYCMHVISNALFEKNSFINVGVTGVMAGNDGRKMSKSFGNYSDTRETLIKYGGDAVRIYLMGSSIMTGDNPSFDEEEIDNQVKTVLFPLTNIVRYMQTYAKIHEWKPKTLKQPESDDLMDKWMYARLKKFHKDFEAGMEEYLMPLAVREIAPFLDDVSTWYIRRNRDRFVQGDLKALETLYYVITQFIKITAPIITFMSEEIYQQIVLPVFEKEPLSVHLCFYPEQKELSKNEAELLESMEKVRKVSSLGLKIRDQERLKIRQPLQKVYVNLSDEGLHNILGEQLNVKEVIYTDDVKSKETENVIYAQEGENELALDIELTDELKKEGMYNDLTRAVQNERKNAGCKLGEMVDMEFYTDSDKLKQLIEDNIAELKKSYNVLLEENSALKDIDDLKEIKIYDTKLKLKAKI